MKLLVIITLSLLATCYSINTQAQQINIRKYSIEDGLVNNDILNIYQDSYGFIWLCTRGGISRYDGSRFTNYTADNGLTNDMINDICEIAPQQFIIAQNSDGPRLLKNGVARAFLPNAGLTMNNFHRASNKKLIATTDFNGIVVWDSSHFKRLDSAYKEIISNITIINDSVWLILQDDVFIQFITPSLKPLSPRLPLNATTVFTDSRHRTWVGTAHGLLLMNAAIQTGKPISFLPLPPVFNLPLLKEAYIGKMIEDSKGNFWICTNKGLVKISANGNTTILTEQDGLPSSIINCIKEDREHTLHEDNRW